MVIPASADRLWEDDPTSIYGLPNSVQVAKTGDLLDQNRGKALGAQFLVYTEEVDFGGTENIGANTELDGNGGNKGDEFPRLGRPDTAMPLLLPSRRHHSPTTRLLVSNNPIHE